jgi:hypothetical protein
MYCLGLDNIVLYSGYSHAIILSPKTIFISIFMVVGPGGSHGLYRHVNSDWYTETLSLELESCSL